jgi:tripartite-type tricarboxylate transporter receptor subunit TctC
VTTWFGVFGPAALPKDIVAKVDAEVARILRLPDVRERLYNDGAEPGNLTNDEFNAFIRADAARWAKLIKATGIKGD